jgi:hypothetical protein
MSLANLFPKNDDCAKCPPWSGHCLAHAFPPAGNDKRDPIQMAMASNIVWCLRLVPSFGPGPRKILVLYYVPPDLWYGWCARTAICQSKSIHQGFASTTTSVSIHNGARSSAMVSCRTRPNPIGQFVAAISLSRVMPLWWEYLLISLFL